MNKPPITLINLALAVLLCLCASGCNAGSSPHKATDNQTPTASPNANGRDQGAVENEKSAAPPDKTTDEVARNIVADAGLTEPDSSDSIAQPQTALKVLGHLLIPVAGKSLSDLRDTFSATRSGGRQHEALDIMASQGTPVMAAIDGVVMKLHKNETGGLMLYQSDPTDAYEVMYAHLSGYADGVSEGKNIKRGDVIGYVGDTGNATPGNYHLHFAVAIMPGPGKWGRGKPLNPYTLLVGWQSQQKSDAIAGNQKDQRQAVDSKPLAAPAVAQKPAENSAGAEGLGDEVVSYASSFIGLEYKFGGTGKDTGFDCSGFAQHIMRKFSVNLPRRSDEQFKEGVSVDKKDIRKGDLVFFTTYRPGASHVGIYIGDNKFIHSPSTGKRIKFDSLDDEYYWKPRYLGARRVLNQK